MYPPRRLRMMYSEKVLRQISVISDAWPLDYFHFQVNNAGAGKIGNIDVCTAQDIDFMYNLLLRSVFVITKRAVPHLRKNKGKLVYSSIYVVFCTKKEMIIKIDLLLFLIMKLIKCTEIFALLDVSVNSASMCVKDVYNHMRNWKKSCISTFHIY